MKARLFLAIPVRLYDYSAIRNAFEPLLRGRWRDETTLHATIAFLGERYDSREIQAKVEGMEWNFEVTEFHRFDYFSRSRVFVATTHNPSLQTMRERLEKRLNLPSDLIHPHATLMRVKTITDPAAFNAHLQRVSAKPIGRLEPRVALYQSRLLPEGARYTVLKEWNL